MFKSLVVEDDKRWNRTVCCSFVIDMDGHTDYLNGKEIQMTNREFGYKAVIK